MAGTEATNADDGPARKPRGPVALALLALVAAVLVAGFCALGIWQVQRLAWKTDLIARTEARLAADPVPAPGPADWPGITPARDEYLKVTVTGTLMNTTDTLVQAVTDRGAGFWVMTPMATEEGWTVLVNRGFVPADRREPGYRDYPEGTRTITGLLRLPEPGGAFLRANDPQADRWFSRDVAAIAQARGLGQVAPYFIDAAAGPDAAALPVGGLTVVSFRNHHLQYALTWFGMALGTLLCAGIVWRHEARLRRAAR
ncbi:SURF1 family protein [Frigidibacter sp. MR17.24]|uniref:SURF1 family protein n=1 Tax=Frigidibacter sp. MR17.24 TaxID=3127345 RepID=UPI003012ABE7